jgi:hypothetical protein
MADDKEKQDQENLKAVQAQNETAKELLSTYEKLKKVKRSLTDDEKAALDISKELIQYSKTLETSIQQRNDKSSTAKELSKTLSQLQKDYNENLEKSGDVTKKLNQQKEAALKKFKQASQTERGLQQTLTEELIAQEEILDKIDRLKRSGGDAEQLANERKNLQLVKQSIKDVERELEIATKRKEEQKNLFKQLNEAKKVHDETLKQQEQEIENLKKETALKKASNVLDAIGNALGLDRLKNMLSLSGIFSFLVNAAYKYDKQVTNLSKSLGVSKEYAEGMRQEMQAYADKSGDGFINTERLMKAQEGLTEQLGIAVDFGNEERETFARLTEITGLTADEAGKLAQNSAAAGMSTNEYLGNIREASVYAQHTAGIHLSEKKILQDISKLSAGILVKFQGNPKAIAEAVVQANKLGLNLSQVDKIGDSLLDWESSINNELEAELITGKKLNLERAREAALTGDQATLMQEIASQAGSLEDFSHMNVIAQQSLAKAFGMTREDMSDMLMKQEAINKYGDKAADLNKEQLDYMERHGMNAEQMQKHLQNQRDTQEKFNDLISKLEEKIVSIVGGPLGKFLEMIINIVGYVITAFNFITSIGTGLGKLLSALGPVGTALKAIAGIIIVMAAYQAYASLAAYPFVGAVLGGIASAAILAAGFAMLSAKSSKGDDVMSEGGYGNRTLLTPKGSIKLNNQDTVIAGTNLGGGGVKKQPTASPGMAAMGAMVGAIDKLAAASNRPAVAYINGRDAFADDMGRNNSLGSSQMQNSYKLA